MLKKVGYYLLSWFTLIVLQLVLLLPVVAYVLLYTPVLAIILLSKAIFFIKGILFSSSMTITVKWLWTCEEQFVIDGMFCPELYNRLFTYELVFQAIPQFILQLIKCQTYSYDALSITSIVCSGLIIAVGFLRYF